MNPPSENHETGTREEIRPPVQGKQAYVKPAIVYSAPLEANATNCRTGPGKAAGQSGCIYSRS